MTVAKRSPRQGLALIVVVGVLGVLAAVAVAFVTMAQLERKASQQRVNAEKAYLLARSGIEDASARLALGQDPAYGGEDWLGDGDQGPGSFDRQQEVYQPGVLNVADCPARHALRPSFFVGDSFSPPRPDLQMVDGKLRGYSGFLAGDHQARGNHYTLKVSPQSGGFYVNGGDPSVRIPLAQRGSAPPSPPANYNDVLKRILGTLCDAIDRDGGAAADGVPVGLADGWALIDKRPRTGWQSFNQIRDVALGGSQAKIDTLKPYLALKAWTDKHVIAPNVPAVGLDGTWYQTWADIKLDHTSPTAGNHAPDFERINGRNVGRAPVDLTWARTRGPALIALLANLQGYYLDENGSTGASSVAVNGDLVGTLRMVTLANSWLASDDCHTAVSAILTSTSALSTWQQFNEFCDTLPLSPGATTVALQAKRDLVKANFNPNSDLNKFNPNPSLARLVDKSDLLPSGYTTEFGLFPISGQDLASVGRVLGKNGRLLGIRILTASLQEPSVVRLSTQKEFICSNLGDLDLPGDETGASVLNSNRSAGLATDRTWGGGYSPFSPGMSLQSYPEPWVNWGFFKLFCNAADYDGNLQLATVDTPLDYFYQTVPVGTTPSPLKMLAPFDWRFDLDLSANIFNWPNQLDSYQVAATQLNTFGLLKETSAGSGVINTLYPDGCYSELGRAPAFRDNGSANGFHGVMSFWVKPNYFIPPGAVGPASGGASSSWRGRRYVSATRVAADASTQFFCLADALPGVNVVLRQNRQFALHFESINSSDSNHEFQYLTLNRLNPAHRWYLQTLSYDFLAPWTPSDPTNNRVGGLWVDSGLASVDQTQEDYWVVNPNTSGADMTQDNILPGGAVVPHRLVLGARQGTYDLTGYETYGGEFLGSGADATIDEFALYDFGGAGIGGLPPAPAVAQSAPITLAQNRYKEGRYYKGSTYTGLGMTGNTAAEWLSAPITLPGGTARIRSLAWTQIVPRGLRSPLPPGGVAGWDGDPDTAAAGGTPGDGQINFELVDGTVANYLSDASGETVDTRFTRDASSPVGRTVSGAFRLHAVFLPNLADPQNTPILDPLALDDITLLYDRPGLGVVSWREGEE